MYLTEKYPECFIEYIPIKVNGSILGIECVGDKGSRILCEIEKRVDIQRAKKAGCRGAVQISDY